MVRRFGRRGKDKGREESRYQRKEKEWILRKEKRADVGVCLPHSKDEPGCEVEEMDCRRRQNKKGCISHP